MIRVVWCVSQHLHAKVLKDALAVCEFLCDEASSGEHRKAAMLELLGLHLLELGGVLGPEAEGVEVDVAGHIVVTETELVLTLEVSGGHPPDLSAVHLGHGDGEDQDFPEGLGDLLEVGDGRAADLSIEQERGALDLLADQEANEGEHGDASVRELGLPEAADLVVVGAFEEVEGVLR